MIIRKVQIEEFRKAVEIALEKRLLTYISGRFGAHAKNFSESELTSLLRMAIANTRHNGMVSEETMKAVLDVMFLLGAGFHRDPLCRPLHSILVDRSIDERRRLKLLGTGGTKLWLEYSGENNSLWFDAIRRFRSFPTNWSEMGDRSLFSDKLYAALVQLYPVKVRLVGEESIAELRDNNGNPGAQLQVKDTAGIAILTAMRLLLGSGILEDPRYGWIHPIVSDKRKSSEERASALHAFAADVFERWLTDESPGEKGRR